MNNKLSSQLVCIGLVFCAFNALKAQSIAPQSVNSSGAAFVQGVGSLTYTVGEIIVLTDPDSEGNTLGSGFTAGTTSTVLALSEPESDVLDVQVFPNPTTDLLHVKIRSSALDKVNLSIHNLMGEEVFRGKYAAISNTIGINTKPYAAGTYILTIHDANNHTLGTYKIIKH